MFTLTIWCLVGVTCGMTPFIAIEDVFYPSEQACLEAGVEIVLKSPAIPPGYWQVDCRKVPTVDDTIKEKVG